MCSRKRRFRKLPLLFTLAVLLCLLIAVEMWLYPLLLSYGEHRAKILATAAVTETVAQVMEESRLSYGDLIAVERDENGGILTLQADSAQLNRIQTTVAALLLEKFGEADRAFFEVPLGTAFGGAFLSGRGPKIRFYVALDGIAEAVLRDEFTAAGINQTYHRVYLDITLQVLLTAMGHRAVHELRLSAVLTQTVLMGAVPNTYIDWQRS